MEEQQPVTQAQEPVHQQQPTQEDYDLLNSMEGYDKPVKRAQVILFIIGAIQIIGAFMTGDMAPIARIITIVITLLVGLAFIALGFWTKHKPYSAIVTALVIYSSLVVMDAIFDPTTIFRGIILKLIIYLSLIVSISNAKEVQRWKESQK